MKIYTKTGDKGSTSLFDGKRVKKYAERVEAYGTVDELNSVIGIALSYKIPDNLEALLVKISNMLFVLGSDLATPLSSKNEDKISRISESDIDFLEKSIDDLTSELPELKNFILPGGSRAGSFLHLARTVCRRAERLTVSLSEREEIGLSPIIYLNRLSDFLFTAARYANHKSGFTERNWEK